jgi:hypothetical protein
MKNVDVNPERQRILNLKNKCDNKEINIEDISVEDMEELIILYTKETEILNKDTAKRKQNIERLLKK